MEMKLTEWFPAYVRPVHEGWYHVKWSPINESKLNWWWDGLDWYYGPGPNQERLGSCVYAWRGLVEPSK